MGKTHGMTNSRIYGIWGGMKSRCHIKSDSGYKNYGAKGISVCAEWGSSFVKFNEWACDNGYEDYLTIDRINPKGNYEPSNCQWITQHEQVIRQDRHAHRSMDDKFIKFMGCGSFMVVVAKFVNSKRMTITATFENIGIARVERNMMEFCIDNSVEYVFPYRHETRTGDQKGNRSKRRESIVEKAKEMLKTGTNGRIVARVLKISPSRVFKIQSEVDKASRLMYHI